MMISARSHHASAPDAPVPQPPLRLIYGTHERDHDLNIGQPHVLRTRFTASHSSAKQSRKLSEHSGPRHGSRASGSLHLVRNLTTDQVGIFVRFKIRETDNERFG